MEMIFPLWTVTGSMCFVLGGLLIPVYGPPLVLDKTETRAVRLFALGATVAWAMALAYSVTWFVRVLGPS